MGAACCVAAKDRTIINGPSGEMLQRHVRYSPSWSFRWENRGRVAGDETRANCSHNGSDGNDKFEVKSVTGVETAFASEEGSPIDTLRGLLSPISNGNAIILRLQAPVNYYDAISKNLAELKELAEFPSVSHPSPIKQSPSGPSVPSSPQTSQDQLLPLNLTPSRLDHSPGHQVLQHVSNSQIPGYKSPTFSISEKASSSLPPAWSNESRRASSSGSSDSWSVRVFSELMATRRQRWSFDSEKSGFSLEKISRSSDRNSGSPSVDLQNCTYCAKPLTEVSSWGWSSDKIIVANQLAVVSVLACGHVFHAECLEYLTPEINKYDPACPVCTYGEKWAVQMSEKALKAELEAKKISRKRVVHSDLKSNFWFDHNKSGVKGRGHKINSTAGIRSSLRKPFLKRPFSFSSKAGKSSPDNQRARRKGLFWARSSKN